MQSPAYKEIFSQDQIDRIRSEFARLDGQHYLDHAGSGLYSEKQIEAAHQELCNNLFSNPHARNSPSKATEDAIDIIRYQILKHFNTDPEEYSVIFTKGATEALEIVGRTFQFNNGTLAYLETNHTSVLGLRYYSKTFKEIKLEQAFSLLNKQGQNAEVKDNSLFVYPAQCNFNGTKYPLDWINKVQSGCLNQINNSNWFVVLDAASYASTNLLDLSKYKPDFVPISFYKIFGYPSGLGALLVRKSSEHLLQKQYLGGGTVLMALSSENVMVPRPVLHERFEDGTVPFLSILAVKHGFQTLKRLGLDFDMISLHTFNLAQYVYKNLLMMHHSNGQAAVKLYHDTNFENVEHQGGIVNFNILRQDGSFVGYAEVMHFANLHNVHLRTGCMCNPGCCQRHLRLTNKDVVKHFDAGHVCGDQHDLVEGLPTGSVRISFGYMSTEEDANQFLKMIVDCFVPSMIRKMPNVNETKSNNLFKKTNPSDIVLMQIHLYPIKSCGAFSPEKEWELVETGLKYDRQWMIVNSSGVCLTQKHNRRLCLIKPIVDLDREVLVLTFKGVDGIEIPLDQKLDRSLDAFPCQSKVCGDRIQGWDCGNEVAEWLSSKLDTPGLRLLQQCSEEGRQSRKRDAPNLSFSNKAQFLLINYASIKWLRGKIPQDDFKETPDSIIQRFRPNFVVNFPEAFEENNLVEFSLGQISFRVVGSCTRCQMICIDQESSEISKEPLTTLSREFKGKVAFGIYLAQENNCINRHIQIGSSVVGREISSAGEDG